MRSMRLILLALQISAPQALAQRPASSAEREIVALVDKSMRRFLEQWRDAWQETQLEIEYGRPKFILSDIPRDGEVRMLALHCHWIATSPRIQKNLIENSIHAHAACPRWYPPDGPRLNDERINLDGGLSPDRRSTIRVLRQTLRALLDSAQSAMPDNIEIMKHRVRFALDASDWGGAAQIAQSCGIDVVQCGLLRGLVLYRLGNVAEADAEFLAALKAMPDSTRCEWNNVAPLLEPSLRKSYMKMSCTERTELENRLWWLSDPLYVEQGNERRAEHYARKVMISLIAPLGFDGHQHWTRKKGGEATAESEIRYGWPSQMFWGGPGSDGGHDQWLIVRGADTAHPYVTREFTRKGRLHTVPSQSAIENPLEANTSDWDLNGKGDDDYDWWPVEHYARDRSGIKHLPEGQSVMLRRKDVTRFVWAGDLDSASTTRSCDDTRASLFVSPWVDELTRAAEAARKKKLIIDHPLTAGRALVGIESPGNTECPAIRTRFAIEVPDPLTSLEGKALSQPFLFEANDDSGAPLSADAALTRMYGTTEFHKPRTLGVYFESYNFEERDTVELEVRMTREDKPGFFTRVAQVFRVGNREAGGGVGIRWVEVPGNSRAVHAKEGSVPVQMRSLVLDVSRLSRGTYRLELLQNTPGKPAASGQRRFVIH